MNYQKKFGAGEALIYLLQGEESLLSREAASWLVERAVSEGSADFNLDKFDAEGEGFQVSRLCSAAQMVPMMAEMRVVWLRAAQRLDKLPRAEVEPLLRYLERPAPKTCLIIEARGNLDKRKPLYKALKKSKLTHIESFEPPKAQELGAWVAAEARRRRLPLTTGAAQLLADAVAGDLGALRGALERLALFNAEAPQAPLDEEQIAELLPEARLQTTVWRFLDTFATRRPEAALAQVHALLLDGQSPLGLLALIVRQLRNQLFAHAVQSRGGGEAAVAKATGLPPFAARKLLRGLSRWSPDELLLALERAAQSERLLKSSRLDSGLIMEAMIIDLCAPR